MPPYFARVLQTDFSLHSVSIMGAFGNRLVSSLKQHFDLVYLYIVADIASNPKSCELH